MRLENHFSQLLLEVRTACSCSHSCFPHYCCSFWTKISLGSHVQSLTAKTFCPSPCLLNKTDSFLMKKLPCCRRKGKRLSKVKSPGTNSDHSKNVSLFLGTAVGIASGVNLCSKTGILGRFITQCPCYSLKLFWFEGKFQLRISDI